MLRFIVVGAVALASIGAAIALPACSCAAACPAITEPILDTEGFVVVAVDSSCANTSLVNVLPTASVRVSGLSKKGTCHFDVTLDDGEHIALDVPFTKDEQQCCCGGCVTVEMPDWTPPTISAPPGYVSHLDAGADALDESTPD